MKLYTNKIFLLFEMKSEYEHTLDVELDIFIILIIDFCENDF